MDVNNRILLFNNLLDRVFEQLNIIWSESGTWQDFIDAMTQTLRLGRADNPGEIKSDRWVLLPGLCCQAAGGDPLWADELAAAWYLFYRAAGIMDAFQDEDELDPCLEKLGPGVILNNTSGIFFTASLLLNRLRKKKEIFSRADDVIEIFYEGFLKMCSGQHRDLVHKLPTLDQFWEIAAYKSGSFFSLACMAGARLATNDRNKVDGYGAYGHHLGVLIQILDDLEELRGLQESSSEDKWLDFSHSLPVVYAIEVFPPSIRSRLLDCLKIAHEDCNAAEESLQMINQSGAVLYIETEIERHMENALRGLSQASPLSPAGEKLNSLLHTLY